MYIERRGSGKRRKYYLVHSYRKNKKVRKIRKYLGRDLTKEELQKAQSGAKQHIHELVKKLNTEVFLFSLSKKQIEKLNKIGEKIKIVHLQKKEWQKFTEEFVYNTNAIEGSRVQREEVPEILDKKEVTNEEELETKGVAQAVEHIKNTKEELSLALIKKLHEVCFKDVKSFAGQLRKVEVVIRDADGKIVHIGVLASQVQRELEDMIKWHGVNKKKFKPVVLAAIIHNQFEYIHPFQDGNGRVGRLLLNFLLLKNNYPPINITLEDRAEYYRTLEEYQENQEICHTVEFLVKQYKKTLKRVTAKRKK